MPEVIMFAEKTATMTIAECLAFIERTRRQVERFEHLPHKKGHCISESDAAEIRRQCNELEAAIEFGMV